MEATIKTKYNIGDEVWYACDAKILRLTVRSMYVTYTWDGKESKTWPVYFLNRDGKPWTSMRESALYDSKEALIASMEA